MELWELVRMSDVRRGWFFRCGEIMAPNSSPRMKEGQWCKIHSELISFKFDPVHVYNCGAS